MTGVPWPRAGRQILASPALERLHPVRLVGALVSTGFVLASAAAGPMLPGAGSGHGLVFAVLAGLMAFNTLLFFAPCALALYPRRFAPILLANVAPIPLVTLLYAANPLLADIVLVILTPVTVFARAHGTTAAAVATILAINTLVALLFAGVPGIAQLGAECGAIGTLAGFAADATATVLLRVAGLGIERRLVMAELARFLGDLLHAWRSDATWPEARLSAHAVRLQQLVAEQTLAATAARTPPPWPQDELPPEDLIEATSRSLATLRGSSRLSRAADGQIQATLAALSVAADAGTLADAAPAVAALHSLACSREQTSDNSIPARLLGIALLFSDLIQAGLLKGEPASPPPAPAPPAASLVPDSISLRLALQSCVCMVLALILMHLLPFPKPYWLPLTAFILVSASFGESARKSVQRIVGTGAGLMAGQLIWIAAGGRTDILIAVIAVSLIGLFSARNAAYRVVLFWLTVMLATVLHLADAPLSFYGARLADTMLGTLIVLLVTGLLLPVRTGEAVKTRLSALLALAAARLNEAALALRSPGPHDRTGMPGSIAGSVQALRDLTAAEELEDGLLRRPRRQPARRQAAADRLVRVLIYVDQLLPVLSDLRTDEETVALLGDMAAAALETSRRIGTGAARGDFGALRGRVAARNAALAAAFADGTLDAPRLQAERSLLRAADGLARVLETLEASMTPSPAAEPQAPGKGQAAAGAIESHRTA